MIIDNKSRRIAIFGGTFDPVHKAHIALAKEALNKLDLDMIIFMVSASPPHKSQVSDPYLRMDMVNMAIKDFPKFVASDYEIRKGGKSYTVDTLKHVKSRFIEDELYFIIGADSLVDLPKWKNAKELFSMITFAVFNRGGVDADTKSIAESLINEYNARFEFVDAPAMEISSTDIKNRIKIGEDVSEFLTRSTLEFIKENNMYEN